MANNRIKGITIEINGDTTKLTKALEGTNRSLSNTQKSLRDVERLLKLDPSNTDLLRQKQELLTKAVDGTTEKLSKLKEAQRQMDAEGIEHTSEEYQGLQREIIATEGELKKLKSAANESNAMLSKIGTVAQAVSDKTGELADKTRALSTAAGGGLVALGGLAYKAVTASDDLNTLSKQSGFTTAEIQKMQYAADRMDVETDTIIKSAQKLKKNMMSTSESVTDAFDALGISVTDSSGQIKDSNTVFWETVEALGRVKDETERDLLAMSLFGRSADDLAGLLDDGGESFRAMGEEAEKLGLILSQDTLDSLNETNDKIDELKARSSATSMELGAKAAEVLLPIFDKVSEGISNLLDWLSNLDEAQLQTIMIILGIVASISPLLSMISKISGGISAISGAMGTLGIAAGPVLGVVAAVVALGAAFKHLWDTNEEFRTAITAIWGNIKETLSGFFQGIVDRLNEFGFGFTDITDVLKAAWNGLCQILAPVFEGAFKYVEVILSTVTGVLTGLLDIFIGIFTGDWNRAWEGVKTVFSSVWSGISGFFSNIINTLRSIADVFLGWFGTSWSSVWGNIKSKTSNAWNGILTAIKTPIEKARDTVKNAIDKIKSFFNFQFSWPKLKLPHFGISPAGWKIGDLLQGSIPKLSISWYAKAMNSPMLLNSPTIFGMAGGNLLGAGEAGAEVVSGAATLMRMIESAMSNVLMLSSPSAASNSTVRHTGTIRIEGVNNRGEFIGAANAVLADMGIGSLTKIIMEEIQAATERREAVY